MRNRLAIFLLLLPLLSFGQDSNKLLLKVRPLTWAVAWNPNLEAEYKFTDRVSLSAEGVWRRRSIAGNGSEGIGKSFHPSQGFAAMLAVRYYFDNNSSPSYFISGGGRYYRFKQSNIAYQGIDGSEAYVRNISSKGPELTLMIGKQFIKDWFVSDVSVGYGAYFRKYEETYVSGHLDLNYFNNGQYLSQTPQRYVYLQWSVGIKL